MDGTLRPPKFYVCLSCRLCITPPIAHIIPFLHYRGQQSARNILPSFLRRKRKAGVLAEGSGKRFKFGTGILFVFLTLSQAKRLNTHAENIEVNWAKMV